MKLSLLNEDDDDYIYDELDDADEFREDGGGEDELLRSREIILDDGTTMNIGEWLDADTNDIVYLTNIDERYDTEGTTSLEELANTLWQLAKKTISNHFSKDHIIKMVRQTTTDRQLLSNIARANTSREILEMLPQPMLEAYIKTFILDELH